MVSRAYPDRAPLAELVDALDSKSSSERSAGSIPAWGTILFRATPPTYRIAPPVLGEHTEAILADVLGLGSGQIGKLVDAGVVAQR